MKVKNKSCEEMASDEQETQPASLSLFLFKLSWGKM